MGRLTQATYSGVPVYEMIHKGIAVMRRRADSWLNATQILKVAGFDKPQRTRILEREIQKGEHEKVQGGYGKYQGTWIPLERGLSLAKQYNCETILRPIMEFQAAQKSPPPAPKHVTAAAKNARRVAAARSASSVPTRTSTRRQPQRAYSEVIPQEDPPTPTERASEDDESMTPSPSEASSSSRTPSPIGIPSHFSSNGRVRNSHPGQGDRYHEMSDIEETGGLEDARSYGDQILEYFISDTNQIPSILVNPPGDYDADMAIDDDGHTALHWAAAMGRIRTVKLLLSAGADIFKVNKSGQTPLMRSVMFANNYDVRKFPELYELLHRSTLNIDNFNRTVFHHVVDVAMSKGKTHAARYYMEIILTRLVDYPKEIADVINFQDEDGETALTMAARCRSKRLVKLLIDHGADPKIVNNDGKSTEDYILEDERFRSSPVTTARRPNGMSSTLQARSSIGAFETRLPLHHSAAGQKASTKAVHDMTSMLESLAASFDQDLREKEKDANQAHALLSNIQAEILESQRTAGYLKMHAERYAMVPQRVEELQTQLLTKMTQRSHLGWQKWCEVEDQRQDYIIRAGGSLELTATTGWWVDEDSGVTYQEDSSDLKALNQMPTDAVAMQAECDALRMEIGQLQHQSAESIQNLVLCQAEAGTSDRMTSYRKLISLSAPGLPPDEVDDNLHLLLETLEAEEPSSSSVAWNGNKQPTGG